MKRSDVFLINTQNMWKQTQCVSPKMEADVPLPALCCFSRPPPPTQNTHAVGKWDKRRRQLDLFFFSSAVEDGAPIVHCLQVVFTVKAAGARP